MPVVEIRTLDGIGTVNYRKTKAGAVEFKVRHPIAATRRSVSTYLTKEKDFQIPESNKIDDFRIDTVVPTTDINYFTQALTEMQAKTGITVIWPNKLSAEDKKKLIRGG
jgi:hypothetical protein